MDRIKELLEELKAEENVKALRELVEAGKKESEALTEIASKLGYEVTAEELSTAIAETRELDDEELENVSGGKFWQGEDAPNGHEIGCLEWYYRGWYDYYSERDTGDCVRQYEDDAHWFG